MKKIDIISLGALLFAIFMIILDQFMIMILVTFICLEVCQYILSKYSSNRTFGLILPMISFLISILFNIKVGFSLIYLLILNIPTHIFLLTYFLIGQREIK